VTIGAARHPASRGPEQRLVGNWRCCSERTAAVRGASRWLPLRWQCDHARRSDETPRFGAEHSWPRAAEDPLSACGEPRPPSLERPATRGPEGRARRARGHPRRLRRMAGCTNSGHVELRRSVASLRQERSPARGRRRLWVRLDEPSCLWRAVQPSERPTATAAHVGRSVRRVGGRNLAPNLY
jgi:hypothetical protein